MHVVATAGHVDHGKSTLVRALTGIEPDRLAEEQRRGLTIDLGYAWTTLPSGEQVAFVDVPGHERFIGTMLAGLGPAPAVLFVVAADEGWSRQSDEHLAAVDALQVRHGLLAVTRSDLADPATAIAQARDKIAETSLGEVDAVTVSGRTGQGLPELRAALDRLVAGLPNPDPTAPVRLWLDRSFSIRGAGTVVTGTLAAGRVAVGDALDLNGSSVTVRGVQSAGVDRDAVEAVARVALNLRGVTIDAVGRGDVLLTPGTWLTTDRIDVRLDPPGPQPAELVLHAGTAAVPVRVRPLGDGHARLALDRALPLRVGDRAVLRNPGEHAVAAGVLVLDADPPDLDRRGAAAARAAVLARGTPTLADDVARRGAVTRDRLLRLGIAITPAPGVRTFGDWLVHDDVWRRWTSELPGLLDDYARAHPLEPAPPTAAVVRALDLPHAALLGPLAESLGYAERDGRVLRPDAEPHMPANVRQLRDKLAEDPFAAPERDELTALRLGRRELASAAKAGWLLSLPSDVVLTPDAVPEAVRRLAALDQPFTTSSARQALGTTRRVAIPLLEHLDSLGATRRIDGSSRTVEQ